MKKVLHLIILCIVFLSLGVAIENMVLSDGGLVIPMLLIVTALFIINSKIK